MASDLVTIGRFGRLHGVDGKILLQSYTEPPEQFFNYPQPLLCGKTTELLFPVRFVGHTPIKDKFIVTLAGKQTEEELTELINHYLYLERDQMPDTDKGYYWHDLIGMEVHFTGNNNQSPCCYGKVKNLIPAGDYDLLRVVDNNNEEKLIPFVEKTYIDKVDMQSGQIHVSWPPDY